MMQSSMVMQKTLHFEYIISNTLKMKSHYLRYAD